MQWAGVMDAPAHMVIHIEHQHVNSEVWFGVEHY
jgi:hypothetical protein